MASQSQWYYLYAGQIIGPLTSSELVEQANAGQLQPETPIRRGTEGNWTPAKKCKGLWEASLKRTDSSNTNISQPSSFLADLNKPQEYEEKVYCDSSLGYLGNGVPSRELQASPDSKSIFDVYKTPILFTVGIICVVIAAFMYFDLDKKDQLNTSLDKLHNSLQGSDHLTGSTWQYRKTSAEDRIGVYAMGCIGSIFLAAGFITRNK